MDVMSASGSHNHSHSVHSPSNVTMNTGAFGMSMGGGNDGKFFLFANFDLLMYRLRTS